MKRCLLIALGLCVAGAVQAEDDHLSVSVGAKAWNAQWTTFSYDVNQDGSTVLIQVVAKDKVVLLPVVSVRYGNFVGSASAYASTDHEFVGSDRGDTRREFDVNLGYHVLPNLALTLGYKKVVQRGGFRYEPAGLVVGASGSAPLGGALALYGSLGFGKLKTSSSTDPTVVQFDANYRLTEVGVAYNLPLDGIVKALTVTLGHRTQVLSSKEALGSQDGRDTTQGVTLGLVATF